MLCIELTVLLLFVVGFDNSQTLHNRILQTIYRKLTGLFVFLASLIVLCCPIRAAGTNFDCSRFGSHWQLVGFQGLSKLSSSNICDYVSQTAYLLLTD